MFTKILVPLDGSTLSEQALAPAEQLAQATGARLLLLRSVQPIYATAPMPAGELEWMWPSAIQDDQRRDVELYLDDTRRRVERAGCAARVLATEGDPAGVIVDTAEHEASDLIVMNTHGESGVRRAVFGSVTERVLHSVSCPVLVTRSDAPLRRMLIPLDGSPLGEMVLPPALEVARALGAQIVLLRVNELLTTNPLNVALSMDWEASESERRLSGEARQAAEAYLREIALRHHLSPADVQTIVLDGSPANRIQEFARLYAIDLIAMSTHGHTGLRRWLYGSVTHKVMRGAHRAMLIVRPDADNLH